MIVFQSFFYILVPSGREKWVRLYFKKVRRSRPPVPSKVMPLATHNKYLLEDQIMPTVDMQRKFGKVWHVVFKICEQT